MAMLRGTPVVLSCVCALHTKGARRSCAHKNMPNTRAGFMKKRQFEWPKLSQLCDLGSASMQIRLSPNFVVLLAHGMNSTQNKFCDYAPARSGSLRLSKSTHLVHIRFRLLWKAGKSLPPPCRVFYGLQAAAANPHMQLHLHPDLAQWPHCR